ncbi:hypothetical protein RFI_40114, partial [Reticulomyxa filosa]
MTTKRTKLKKDRSIIYRDESDKRFDVRDSGGKDLINYLQIAKDLAPVLTRIPFQKFPLPSPEVGQYIDSAVLHVFAVLIKHNLLAKTAMKMLADKAKLHLNKKLISQTQRKRRCVVIPKGCNQSNINKDDTKHDSDTDTPTSQLDVGNSYTALDLSALLRLLWNDSPRTRVVTLRILRHVLSSHAAPKWQ